MLAALGVSEELLMQDYLRTEKYLQAEHKIRYIKKKYQVAIDDAVLRPALEMSSEYLRGALDVVCAEIGSLESYLRVGLSVTAGMQHELRRKLLEV